MLSKVSRPASTPASLSVRLILIFCELDWGGAAALASAFSPPEARPFSRTAGDPPPSPGTSASSIGWAPSAPACCCSLSSFAFSSSASIALVPSVVASTVIATSSSLAPEAMRTRFGRRAAGLAGGASAGAASLNTWKLGPIASMPLQSKARTLGVSLREELTTMYSPGFNKDFSPCLSSFCSCRGVLSDDDELLDAVACPLLDSAAPGSADSAAIAVAFKPVLTTVTLLSGERQSSKWRRETIRSSMSMPKMASGPRPTARDSSMPSL
mmetsp:Transcript_7526/g.14669  ORF Transcript_7526/g.14669 Transcript_7526/m.14669 type:complete len:269 (+) Transcript_7526:2258-3064(+)